MPVVTIEVIVRKTRLRSPDGLPLVNNPAHVWDLFLQAAGCPANADDWDDEDTEVTTVDGGCALFQCYGPLLLGLRYIGTDPNGIHEAMQSFKQFVIARRGIIWLEANTAALDAI